MQRVAARARRARLWVRECLPVLAIFQITIGPGASHVSPPWPRGESVARRMCLDSTVAALTSPWAAWYWAKRLPPLQMKVQSSVLHLYFYRLICLSIHLAGCALIPCTREASFYLFYLSRSSKRQDEFVSSLERMNLAQLSGRPSFCFVRTKITQDRQIAQVS